MTRSPDGHVIRVYRSLPLWLAQEYLCALGGAPLDAESVQGGGWHAVLSDAPDIVLGAVRVGQIQILFRGDAPAVRNVIAAFEKKAVRAGG